MFPSVFYFRDRKFSILMVTLPTVTCCSHMDLWRKNYQIHMTWWDIHLISTIHCKRNYFVTNLFYLQVELPISAFIEAMKDNQSQQEKGIFHSKLEFLEEAVSNLIRTCFSWQQYLNNVHPNISMHTLQTALYTLAEVLTWRICFTIKSSFSWWLFPLFLWGKCVIQGWYYEGKVDASHSWGSNIWITPLCRKYFHHQQDFLESILSFIT